MTATPRSPESHGRRPCHCRFHASCVRACTAADRFYGVRRRIGICDSGTAATSLPPSRIGAPGAGDQACA